MIVRLLTILWICRKYALFELLPRHKWAWWRLLLCAPVTNIPLAIRLRLALEELGPIFVKFGQLISTRTDVLRIEYLRELTKLQQDVPPFSAVAAQAIVESALGCSISTLFSDFSVQAVAAASIAQVHRARLLTNNQEVAIKIMRPNIRVVISQDLSLLRKIAFIAEKIFKDGKRLRLRLLVQEFTDIIYSELDFLQEAANATELARLHHQDQRIKIPIIYHDLSNEQIIVMEWMNGTPISNVQQLLVQQIDLVTLAKHGVEIFYTQVFKFGFFHADMHPGNILCATDGRYVALDFGIVGCLSDADKRYLAVNLVAFFNRDYKKVAVTHVESGWAPADTNIEAFEQAIRTVCEPIFNKPLAQISFAQILIKLFQVTRKFNIVVQPQLLLLQKTIVNIESLGQLLDPQLDLWKTAQPILNNWLKEQMGVKGFIKNIRQELQHLINLPQLPRLLHLSLTQIHSTQNNIQLNLLKLQKRQQWFNVVVVLMLAIILFMFVGH